LKNVLTSNSLSKKILSRKVLSSKNLNIHQQIKRFRLVVLLFFVCLSLPLSMIVYYGFQKFENEMLLEYRLKSSSAVVKFNNTINKRLSTEQFRSAEHYYYQLNKSSKQTNLYSSNRSPLTRDTEPHYLYDLHGLVGFFNIVDNKHFNSPLLPHPSLSENLSANLPYSKQSIKTRLTKIAKVKEILIENKLLEVEKEQNNAIEPLEKANDKFTKVGNFQIIETKNQQLIFYRNLNINQQASKQGFIVDKETFFYKLLGLYIRRAGYDNKIQVQLVDRFKSDFSYFYQYDIDKQGKASIEISSESNNALTAINLFDEKLITPFQQFSVKFTNGELPLGSATSFVLLFIVVLSLVIVTGTMGFYWLGVKQIALAEQRMNFVSSISHELKTPLTSIMMYSEMLKSNMVQDVKNQQDYHHFIFDESERLSRLINNVLQLSNLNRNQEVISPEYVKIDVLKDIIQSKVSTLINKNNFQLNFIIDEKLSANTQAFIDLDAFSQIVINLIDNAVKFFNAAKIEDQKRQVIDVSFTLDKSRENTLVFSIRDYGPGISHSQLDKIFELFYRCGNEMTRTSSGTGIGLALVHQLVIAQGGEILVKRQQQGVSFELSFVARQS